MSKELKILLLTMSLILAISNAIVTDSKTLISLQLEFQGWSTENNKKYFSKTDYDFRFKIYLENKLEVEKHNQSLSTYTKSLNIFGDLTDEEFMQKHTSKIYQTKKERNQILMNLRNFLGKIINVFWPENKKFKLKKQQKIKNENLTVNEIDWEKAGKMSPIKDQDECGGCYAFASIAAIEAAYAIKTGNIVRFSEQFLINCGWQSKIEGLNGCSGGSLISAMEFFKQVGIQLEKDVPFIGKDGKCELGHPVVLKVKDVEQDIWNVGELMMAVLKGPVAVNIEVTRDYKLYDGGIMDLKYPCGFYINHGMTVVGFVQGNERYFKLKNSYGEKFGEKGYIRVEMSEVAEEGFCGITNGPIRPIL